MVGHTRVCSRVKTASKSQYLSSSPCILLSSRISNGSQYGAKGVRGSSPPPPRPSSPNAAQLPLRTPPLQPIHPREPKEKSGYLLEYLFCIVLWNTKDASLCYKQAHFAERNNNLELCFLCVECIINVISSCLCPSVCVEWWVWAPGMDGLGTRAARL